MEIHDKVFEGDCREVLREFPESSIAACVTDPPYNYEFVGHKWNVEEIRRRLQRANDENSSTLVKNLPYGSGLAGGVRNERWYERVRENILDYQSWCADWAKEVFRVCKPGALVLVFNSTRTVAHVQIALESAGFYARDCVVYRRPSGIPKGLNAASQLKRKGIENYKQWKGWHSCLRNEWEAITVVQKPLIGNYTKTLLKYNVGLFYTENDDGSFQSNIIEDIPQEETPDYNVHCTVKPLGLMKKLVRMVVPPSKDNIVLDPFAGSGTTLVAAKELGISYVGIEMIPEYVNIINRRLTDTETKDIEPNEQPRNLKLFPLDNF